MFTFPVTDLRGD